jgi:hypothetical protein
MMHVFFRFLPEDKLSTVGAEVVEHAMVPLMLARKGEITLDAVLDNIQQGAVLGWYSCYQSRVNGKQVLSLTHDFGPKDSHVLAATVSKVFDLVGIRPKVTTTDSSVVVEY